MQAAMRYALPMADNPIFKPSPTAQGPSRGAPLPSSLCHEMEIRLSQSFDDVRVFQGTHVLGVGATAYTTGTEIHFAPGRYQPGTGAGRDLIAHELAHVAQQGQPGGPATLANEVAAVSDETSASKSTEL